MYICIAEFVPDVSRVRGQLKKILNCPFMCMPIGMEVTLCLIILTFIVWESISIRLEVSLDVWILKRFHQMTLIENTTKSDENDSTKNRWTVGRKLPSPPRSSQRICFLLYILYFIFSYYLMMAGLAGAFSKRKDNFYVQTN